MDEIAGKTNEEVIMQTGSTVYNPKNGVFFNFVDDDEKILNFFKQARVIVAHAGAGTLLTALSLNKPIIVVPRQKKYGEHIDDQQIELATILSNQKTVIAVYDIDELEKALKDINRLTISNESNENNLIFFLKNCLLGDII
jgi:UDP-N-acetylglucosamine transferase subunit ALG13